MISPDHVVHYHAGAIVHSPYPSPTRFQPREWAFLIGGLSLLLAVAVSCSACGQPLSLLRVNETIAEGDERFAERAYGDALEHYNLAIAYLDVLQQLEEVPNSYATLRATVRVRTRLAAIGVSLTE